MADRDCVHVEKLFTFVEEVGALGKLYTGRGQFNDPCARHE